jgi:2-iminobutanoate/2-iminopropanoate deaminase
MKKVISSTAAPQALGPYSQAIEAGNTLYVSGQVPINPATGKVEATGIEEQTEQVMKNIGAILKEAGYGFENVVKSTCLLSDMADFAGMNKVYGLFYTQNPPARATFAVKGLPLGVLVEIECIAVK